MIKRLLASIFSIFMITIMFLFQSTAINATEYKFYIIHNDVNVSNLTIEENEKETIQAYTLGYEVDTYQWQILQDQQNEIWVDIYDANQKSLDISYALVKNMTNENNIAFVRCAITVGEETIYSETLQVLIKLHPVELGNVSSYGETEYVLQSEGYSYTPTVSTFTTRNIDEYVSITIKYLDFASYASSGTEHQIYSSYVATIKKNSDETFSQNVITPTFLGFAPYYDGDGDGQIDEDASVIVLNYTNLSNNVEINVYYKPIKVDFAIRYFFQNVNNDLYTERPDLYHQGKEETGKEITDAILKEHAGDTTGFEKLYHVPTNVAADGSTVFECYYDRTYHLIQFDMNGGLRSRPYLCTLWHSVYC